MTIQTRRRRRSSGRTTSASWSSWIWTDLIWEVTSRPMRCSMRWDCLLLRRSLFLWTPWVIQDPQDLVSWRFNLAAILPILDWIVFISSCPSIVLAKINDVKSKQVYSWSLVLIRRSPFTRAISVRSRTPLRVRRAELYDSSPFCHL